MLVSIVNFKTTFTIVTSEILICQIFLQVAAEVAAPLSQAKKITMVSSGNGDIGAAKLTGEVLAIVNKVPELVKNITGVDIARVRSNSEFI